MPYLTRAPLWAVTLAWVAVSGKIADVCGWFVT